MGGSGEPNEEASMVTQAGDDSGLARVAAVEKMINTVT